MSGIWHPVRRLIVERAAQGPATLPELAEAAGVHLNTARTHVQALEESGALRAEAAPPAGRGRPPLRYRLADDFTLPTSDFRGLAELLATAVVRSDQSAEELHRVGEDWGRYLVGRPGAQELERVLPAALERLGFDARLEGHELVLSACPCRLVSPGRPELVCNLAIAVTEGVLAGCGSELHVTARTHDPERRRCAAVLA
ncbi:MAG TPA: helix-turn-helix domain-containing protein [Thermoleophilaceae bacterium]